MLGQNASPRRPPDRPRLRRASRGPTHERRGLRRVSERQYFAPDVERGCNIRVVLGQITAAISRELDVPQLEIALVGALQVAPLVQSKHDPTAREEVDHFFVRE